MGWLAPCNFKFILVFVIQIMINSYFRTIINKPPTQSSSVANRFATEKSYSLAKYKKYKLMLLLLARATFKTLRIAFQTLSEGAKAVPQGLARLGQLCEKNANLTVFLAFDRIKLAASNQKSNQKILKNVVNLLQRIQKYKLKQSFGKLVLHNARGDQAFIENFYAQRGSQFARKLVLLVKRQKKGVLDRMLAWAKFVKSYSKLRVVAVIRAKLERQGKQLFFNRLHRFLLKKYGKGVAQKEVGELKTQLQDLAVQLQNKNENIQRLETEITQLKVDQSSLSYGEYNNNRSKGGVYKTYSQKKLSFNDRSRNSIAGSNEQLSIGDVSIGSILGNLNRSRTGSISKFDSGCQCSCGFRAKYQKYKNLNESLKNQLQIVKEELEVAKDLNQHFTNQIKQFLSGEGSEGDYQKLKREHQALIDERDSLREKVFKYQKHINNLKAEFKVKMEQLYRKVRKEM